jgi:hypothetical protein
VQPQEHNPVREKVGPSELRDYYRRKLAAIPKERFAEVPERSWRMLDRMMDNLAGERMEGMELSHVVAIIMEEFGLAQP